VDIAVGSNSVIISVHKSKQQITILRYIFP
jgi:hypothetical protein